MFPARTVLEGKRVVIATRWIGRILLALSLATLSLTSAGAPPEASPIRIGVNASVLKQNPEALPAWQAYLSARLKRPVEFVHRESYREMIDVIKSRLVEFAWLSDYPYAYLAKRGRVRLLLTPISRSAGTNYFSYLFVPASDTKTHSLLDLRGRVFAFTDPYSLTGYQVPRFWLRELGERDPDHFFRKTFFTSSHRNTITAVLSGLADAGMVDSYAWDMATEREPELAGQVRIVARSFAFGFPPVVILPQVSARDAGAMRATLLAMAQDPEGQRLLAMVGLSGFEIGNPRKYRRVLDILDAVQAAEKP